MDEYEIDQEVNSARLHDRWSVLIVGLNFATQVAVTASNTLEQYTVMAVQHANQKMYDRKFNKIVSDL